MGRASKKAALTAADPAVVEFIEAAAIGDVRTVKKLAKAATCEVDADVDGVTAVMRACGNGHLGVVEELLGFGAGMWCAGPTGDPKTPFMWAAHHGQLEIIRYFVEEVGMDDMAINKGAGKSGRKTARDYALDAGNNLGEEARAKKAIVLAYLQENGAEHGEGVTDPETVFNGAARGDVDYVHFCLEANGDIIHASHGLEGSTLLHVASNTGNIDLMQNLIFHGANTEARNSRDTTALMTAATGGHAGVLRLLLENGVTLEHRDFNGDTALHLACVEGHLECVRALLARDTPSARPGTDEGVKAATIIEGGVPEQQMPVRQLSPKELLTMKNKAGHTPVIKAFAGGVHVGVIRYVLGVQDANVDPIRFGKVDAEPPALLGRCLFTDGIVLEPPPPVVEEPETDAKEKGGGGRGMFACGEDGADGEDDVESDDEQDLTNTEEFKSAEDLPASNGLPYPVVVPPGLPSHGHRRLTRFIETMKTSVWGFDAEKVLVMTRTAVLEQTKIPTFAEANKKNLLQPLSAVPPAATVLYVSHRWSGPGKADSDDGHTHMQLNRYLEEHAGQGIHYIWLDVSCIDLGDKEHVEYEQYMGNVVTVLSRSTHLLAVPPCKLLDPRELVRDMSVAKMAEKSAASAEGPSASYLKSVPSSASMRPRGLTTTGGGSVANSYASLPLSSGGRGGDGGGGGGGSGATSTRKAPTSAEAIAQAVEEEVNAAILARKATHPDKWSMLLTSTPEGEEAVLSAAAAAGESGDKVADGRGGGGGKANKPAAKGTPAAAAGGGGGGGGASLAGKKGGGGGGSSARRLSNASAGGTVASGKDIGGKKTSWRGGGAAAKRAQMEAEAAEAAAAAAGGMTKKEKRAALVQQAREEAAEAAAEVTNDVAQTPAVLKEPVLYSDPAALLNRGWVEMEISLALVFGVQVLVCARWGPKVTFQTVLVKSIMAEDGVTEEQAPGFKGAFLNGLERIAPDIEEATGLIVAAKRALKFQERSADATVPVKVTYLPMLNDCHEPQSVVAPLVRASLALHNEGALLPFLAGDLTPVDLMYRLSGLALRDVKEGFAGLGPISDERDRVTLVRLYLVGLSYAMGVMPKGEAAVGKPKWQVLRDYAHAQRKIADMEKVIEDLQHRRPEPKAEARDNAPAATVQTSGGCKCTVM